MRIYTKVASGEGADWTWTLDAGDYVTGVVRSYKDVYTAAPIDVQGSATSGASAPAAPSVNVTKINAFLVTSFAAYDSGASLTWTPPAGQTDRYLENSQFASAGADEQIASIGMSGSRLPTFSSAASGASHVMALVPRLVAKHTFTLADSTDLNAQAGDVGTTWTVPTGAFEVQSSKATSINGIAVVNSGISDGVIQVTPSGMPYAGGLVFRYTDTSNYWIFYSQGIGNDLSLIKYVGGVPTTVWTTTQAVNSDIFKVVLNGSSIDVYLTGVLMHSATDAFNSSATHHGISGAGGFSNTFDDFSASR
jgi:hypothetical protein